MEVRIVPVLKDNYSYVIVLAEGSVCIDPSEAGPVMDHLEGNLLAIINTHHHVDHIDGNAELVERFQCPLIAPNDERIPNITTVAHEGNPINIGELHFDVLDVPGHSKTHVAYYCPEHAALFCGDVLFGGGCGRVIEGTMEQLYTSLQRLAKLPAETKVFCGHEYTMKNLEFAISVDTDNPALQKRFAHAQTLIAHGAPTIPTTIGLELETNPFLRAPNLEEFTRLRQAKDKYEKE